MTTTTENGPVTAAPAATVELDLRALGVAADAGAEATGNPAADFPVELPDPAKEPEKAKPEATADDKAKEEAAAKKDEVTAKEPTPYELAKKRASEAKEAAAAKVEPAKETKPETSAETTEVFRDSNGYTAEQYEKAAKRAEEEGDDDLAEMARGKANEVRQAETEHRQKTHVEAWKNGLHEQLKGEPELLKAIHVRGSAENADWLTFLHAHPVFALHPQGGKLAAELYLARKGTAGHAQKVSGLEKELGELRKERDRLVKLTSVSGSGPARVESSGSKELSEKDLRALASEQDNSW